MSGLRISRGVVLPSLGQLLTLAVGLSAAWLVWSQFREPDFVSTPAPPQVRDPTEKLRLTEELANLGAEAVPELTVILADPDPLMRRNALLGLGRIGPEAGQAIDEIRERLADESPQVRESAIVAFWRISRDPDEAAGPIARMLADRHLEVRDAAAKILEAIGRPAAGAVAEMLGSDSVETRVLALNVLRKSGWDSSAVEVESAVRNLLKDADHAVHIEALTALVMRGTPTAHEIRKLLEKRELVVLRGERRFPHINFTAMDVALKAISRMGPQAAEFLSDLLALLRDDQKSHATSAQAIPALCAMKSAARPAIPLVLSRFHKLTDAYARVSFTRNLFDIGMEPEELVPILLPLLDDRDLMVCLEAGKVLAQVDPTEARRQVTRLIPRLETDLRALLALEGMAAEAVEAVPALIPLVESADPVASAVAVETLGGIGPDAALAVPALVARLARRATQPTTRDVGLIEALTKIGQAARGAVPALVAIVNKPVPAAGPHSDSPTREIVADGNARRERERFLLAAIAALSRFGDNAPSTISALRLNLKHPSRAVRIAAIEALRQVGDSSPELLDDLISELRVRVAEVRAHAALAIGSLAGDRRSAVRPLISALSDDNGYVRTAAARSLGRIGADAKSAVPALRQTLQKRGNVLANSAIDPALGLPPGWTFRIPELDEISVAEAVRTALSEIEGSDPTNDAR